MKSFEIEDVKNFMNELLVNERYDSFYLYEARIKTNLDYYIGGKVNMDFYDDEDKEKTDLSEYICWKQVKHTVYELMKGKRLPINFKIILMFNNENVNRLIEMNNLPIKPEDVGGLFFNIYFEKGELTITTGVSLKIFTLDKTLEHIWDDTVEKYYV